jgi:hypothetical protein
MPNVSEDASTHTLVYANADLSKASQNREVIAFADHWKTVTGHDPALLIFDSKLTTQAQLAELDDRKIGFITLRARHPSLTRTLAALAALPATAWTAMTLGRAGNKTRRVRVHDDPATALSAYPRPIRQLAVTGLGHDQPTLLITNRPGLPGRHVIQSYARRMNIEQRLAEAIQPFSLDALAGAVPLNVDLDVVLSVLAHTVCAALRRRLPARLQLSHPRHPPAPVPQHRRDHRKPPNRDRGPAQPAHLLTRPAAGQPAQDDHRPLVARPHPPLRVRLTQLGGDSLSENRR